MLGLYIVRGDNIVLLGDLDDTLNPLQKVPQEELSDLVTDGIQPEDRKVVWDFE